ncbi:MAG: HAD-IC family P-type ATPase [Oscillospiraceae bacterium]|nr:HAD-IC family P-type ATPase [Oscillospiraceae bacterium]
MSHLNNQNLTGLTSSEVQEREKAGKINGDCNIPSKSISEIIRTNSLTFFNLLNIFLAAAVFFTGEYKNMMFLGVIIANTAIGITQEIRAKRVTDKLSLLSAAKARVLRGGVITEIPTSMIVQDDVILLSEGMQIPADCRVLSGEIEVNESLVTGESDPVGKSEGTTLLSGSFVICGEAAALITGIGEESFAFSIMKGAKTLKKSVSQMQRSVDKFIKALSFVIVPVGIILLLKSLFYTEESANSLNNAINSSVAAVIGMIPQGLILLISVIMAISVMRLSKHKALARDMYCAETLARTDVLCLDKTGTITTGDMLLEEVLPLSDTGMEEIKNILCALMWVLPDKNPTALAIKKTCMKNIDWKAVKTVPFSSARKWSGACFKNKGSYILGAMEFVFKQPQKIPAHLEGKRVLVLAYSPVFFKSNELPDNLEPVALLVISDVVRPEAKKTLRFFEKQGVTVKIISGDNPLTVKSTAFAAGVKNADKIIDMSRFDPNNKTEMARLPQIAEQHTIFGRVTPQMKLEIIKALKKKHVVGMVGDGVNDVLPLKEADCSVAMQSGSEAARNVSGLVLLDNNFSSLPKAVEEGRRSINNLERSAALFLSKTVYSLILAVIFIFLSSPYPFIPIQMTLINGLFIGLPSFILALEKNFNLVKGSFIKNVLMKAVPYGLCGTLGISLLAVFAAWGQFSFEETRTAATIILGVASYAVLCRICRPINRKRLFLITACGLLFSFAVQFFDDLLAVSQFTPQMHGVTFFLCAGMIPACIFLPKLAEIVFEKFKK